MFSGSGIVNDHKMLGLLEDALVFFYTTAGDNNKWSAGKQFTQRIAYSTDGGETLHKGSIEKIQVLEEEVWQP